MEAFSTEVYTWWLHAGIALLAVLWEGFMQSTFKQRKVNVFLKIVLFFFFWNPPTVKISPDRNSRRDSIHKSLFSGQILHSISLDAWLKTWRSICALRFWVPLKGRGGGPCFLTDSYVLPVECAEPCPSCSLHSSRISTTCLLQVPELLSERGGMEKWNGKTWRILRIDCEEASSEGRLCTTHIKLLTEI